MKINRNLSKSILIASAVVIVVSVIVVVVIVSFSGNSHVSNRQISKMAEYAEQKYDKKFQYIRSYRTNGADSGAVSSGIILKDSAGISFFVASKSNTSNEDLSGDYDDNYRTNLDILKTQDEFTLLVKEAMPELDGKFSVATNDNSVNLISSVIDRDNYKKYSSSLAKLWEAIKPKALILTYVDSVANCEFRAEDEATTTGGYINTCLSSDNSEKATYVSAIYSESDYLQ